MAVPRRSQESGNPAMLAGARQDGYVDVAATAFSDRRVQKTTARFGRISLRAMAIAVTILAGEQFAAEPTVVESREGGTSVIRIASMGQEQVYRIDLSGNHVPASERDEVLRQWES